MDAVKNKIQIKPAFAPAKSVREAALSLADSPNDDVLRPLEALLEITLRNQGPERANVLLSDLIARLRRAGVAVPATVSTPYINTIPPKRSRRIRATAKSNGASRAWRAGTPWPWSSTPITATRGVGGHISSYASMATLYEVAYNHFFRGGDGGRLADLIYFQGHTTPGNYARAFLEYRHGRRASAQFPHGTGRGRRACPPIRIRI